MPRQTRYWNTSSKKELEHSYENWRSAAMVDCLFVDANRVGFRIYDVGCLSPLGADIHYGRHRRSCNRSNGGCFVWRGGYVKERRYRKLHFYNNQFAGIIQFRFSTARTLFGFDECRRISNDRQECDCSAGVKRHRQLAAFYLVAD